MNGDYKPVGRPSGESGRVEIDYAELRQKAEKAAGGEWFCDPKPTKAGLALVDNGTSSMHSIRAEWHEAAYIVAAQPSTVLALLDRIEELEGALKPFARYDELANRGRKGFEEELGIHTTDDDGAPASLTLHVHDFRRARKALSGEKP